VAIVRRRLGAMGSGLDEADLEACYAAAWQGLYAAVLEGREISNPAGWLVLATYRRAIDEQRARVRAGRAAHEETCQDPDLAGRLDDRDRLRELFEGLRTRLGEQERQAAVLCYLHGFTRAEAAARMGISERRMRRLMEGRGPGRPGVSEKLGELASSITEGSWCEQQGSLMRGLAFGILDRDGERYRVALAHSSRCSSCRAYVASLRGLASVLPPVFLPGSLSAAILSRVGEGAGAAAAHSGAAGNASGGVLGGSTGGAVGGSTASAGAGGLLGGAGAAGAGGAGSGWIFAGGPLGVKIAAGCLVALGVGASCVGIGGVALNGGHGARHEARRSGAGSGLRHARLEASGGPGPASAGGDSTSAPVAGLTVSAGGSGTGSAGARAAREFGPEQALSGASSGAGSVAGSAGRASTASLGSRGHKGHRGRSAAASALEAQAVAPERVPEASAPVASSPGGETPPSQAAREFSPG